MNENDDQNLKKAKDAETYLMLQQKAKDYQDKLSALQNKEYQGRVFGVSISMKGSYEVFNVTIDQSFYETAGKEQIEKAFLTCLSNLHKAVESDQNTLRDELQSTITQFQKDNMNNGTN